MLYKVPLVLTPEPEGGYTVTSPSVPELITCGENVDECLENARDAFQAVLELYEDEGKALPPSLGPQGDTAGPVLVETVFTS